jgi:hypothetical protein
MAELPFLTSWGRPLMLLPDSFFTGTKLKLGCTLTGAIKLM